MSDVKCRDAERELLTLAILDGTIDRPTAADLVRCIDKLECRIDALERRIKQLEDHDLDTAIRVSNMERKLNHKGVDGC